MKRGRCNKVTRGKPTIALARGLQLSLAMAISQKEGMTAASTVIFLRQESLFQEEARVGGKKSKGLLKN